MVDFQKDQCQVIALTQSTVTFEWDPFFNQLFKHA